LHLQRLLALQLHQQQQLQQTQHNLATTAFVQQEITANAPDLSVLYPVGSVYINAAVSTNPGTLLGFGTWAAFGAGRVLVGLDAGDVDFDTVEETGGAKDAYVDC
jgi:hypothetical protein